MTTSPPGDPANSLALRKARHALAAGDELDPALAIYDAIDARQVGRTVSGTVGLFLYFMSIVLGVFELIAGTGRFSLSLLALGLAGPAMLMSYGAARVVAQFRLRDDAARHAVLAAEGRSLAVPIQALHLLAVPSALVGIMAIVSPATTLQGLVLAHLGYAVLASVANWKISREIRALAVRIAGPGGEFLEAGRSSLPLVGSAAVFSLFPGLGLPILPLIAGVLAVLPVSFGVAGLAVARTRHQIRSAHDADPGRAETEFELLVQDLFDHSRPVRERTSLLIVLATSGQRHHVTSMLSRVLAGGSIELIEPALELARKIRYLPPPAPLRRAIERSSAPATAIRLLSYHADPGVERDLLSLISGENSTARRLPALDALARRAGGRVAYDELRALAESRGIDPMFARGFDQSLLMAIRRLRDRLAERGGGLALAEPAGDGALALAEGDGGLSFMADDGQLSDPSSANEGASARTGQGTSSDS